MHFRFSSAGRMGTPAPPAVPLPRCRWEQLPIRGRRGPSLPAGPSLPHLRKTHLLRKLLRNLFQGVSPPAKGQHFAQVRGLPIGKVGRSLSLPVGSRGGYPPAPPPRPEQGRAQCVPVGRRAASPLFGFATSPALRSFAAPRPGRLRPAAGSATAPPSIWCGACAPVPSELSVHPPWHRWPSQLGRCARAAAVRLPGLRRSPGTAPPRISSAPCAG